MYWNERVDDFSWLRTLLPSFIISDVSFSQHLSSLSNLAWHFYIKQYFPGRKIEHSLHVVLTFKWLLWLFFNQSLRELKFFARLLVTKCHWREFDFYTTFYTANTIRSTFILHIPPWDYLRLSVLLLYDSHFRSSFFFQNWFIFRGRHIWIWICTSSPSQLFFTYWNSHENWILLYKLLYLDLLMLSRCPCPCTWLFLSVIFFSTDWYILSYLPPPLLTSLRFRKNISSSSPTSLSFPLSFARFHFFYKFCHHLFMYPSSGLSRSSILICIAM